MSSRGCNFAYSTQSISGKTLACSPKRLQHLGCAAVFNVEQSEKTDLTVDSTAPYYGFSRKPRTMYLKAQEMGQQLLRQHFFTSSTL
ncbi:unnamed protein product [Rhodiola kirilowii]